ncbi:MAG TPA: HdeD family acid-resistance protein [Bryobacteraceae bacterium]|nr:HdeD family acid-resistance protein [Bryobacteraceae bacterium]
MADHDSISETPGMFAGRWWTMVLRGIVAILFAVLAFAWPGETTYILMILFGGYAVVDGLFMVIAAIGGRPYRHGRWLLALEGIVGISVGMVVLKSPKESAMALVFFISIWAVALGFLRIMEAMRLRRELSGEMWLALSGVIAVLFAVMLMVRPLVGAVELIWLIAGFALVTGIFEILVGIEVHRPPDRNRSHSNGWPTETDHRLPP